MTKPWTPCHHVLGCCLRVMRRGAWAFCHCSVNGRDPSAMQVGRSSSTCILTPAYLALPGYFATQLPRRRTSESSWFDCVLRIAWHMGSHVRMADGPSYRTGGRVASRLNRGWTLSCSQSGWEKALTAYAVRLNRLARSRPALQDR